MLAGFLCVLVLAGALLIRRTTSAATTKSTLVFWNANASERTGGRREKIFGAVGVLIATLIPVVVLLPGINGQHATFHGDDMTHARIAADVAEHGLPHGWIDSYMGGFPFGHHYPPSTWLVLAALVRVGFSPLVAANVVGTIAIIAVPLSVYFAAIHCGARVSSAVAGGVFVVAVSPYNQFVGGYEVFFHSGLLSQALGTPPCILLTAVVVRARSPRPAVLLAVAAMATHPQLALATFVALVPAISVAAHRAPIERAIRAGIAAVISGAALYGAGMAMLQIPFGWPPSFGWRRFGFPPERIVPWIVDGDLLDLNRGLPIMTALTAASLLALTLRLRRPAPRAVLVAAAIVLASSVSGGLISNAGKPWATLLAFVQPLRMVAFAPLAAAALVIIALEEAAPVFANAVATRYPRLVRPLTEHGGFVLAILMLVIGMPSRVTAAQALAKSTSVSSEMPCGPTTPPGYRHDEIRTWLHTLAPDRMSYDPTDNAPLFDCGERDAMELATPGPIGVTSGAGSHVGVHWVAFRQIRPDRLGSATRAEALGIRYLLRVHHHPKEAMAAAAVPPAGWRLLRVDRDLELLENEGTTRLIGVGCIRETWRGSNDAIRNRLERELLLSDKVDGLLSTKSFVALDIVESNDLEPTIIANDSSNPPCSVDNGDGDAKIAETRREPGAVEGVITSSTPVDVVLRVTALPLWSVEVDGVKTRTTMVAPGFIAVHMPTAGSHHVVAIAEYGFGWPSYILAPLLLAIVYGARRPHLDALLRRLQRIKLRLKRRGK